MAAVKSKQQLIAERVLKVLEDFPDAGDRQVFLEVFLAFTVGNSQGPAQSRSVGGGKARATTPSSSKSSKKKNDRSGSSTSKKDLASASGADSSRAAPGGAVDETGGREYVDVESASSSSVPLLKAVVSDHSKAQRQPGATKPRMDHKSIKVRVTSARRSCRKALSQWKDHWKGDRSEDLSIADLGRAKDLVNSVKSFRLVFYDAHAAKLPEINIGIDLHSRFIEIDEFEWIASQLEKSALVKNDQNFFWEDPEGILSTTLSAGSQQKVNSNPFS
jgi:hypothetical protein